MSSQVSVFLIDYFNDPIEFSSNTVEKLYEILIKELKLTISHDYYNKDEELNLLKNNKYIAINPYYEEISNKRILLFSNSLEDLIEQRSEASASI
jgi:hypothetical protein